MRAIDEVFTEINAAGGTIFRNLVAKSVETGGATFSVLDEQEQITLKQLLLKLVTRLEHL